MRMKDGSDWSFITDCDFTCKLPLYALHDIIGTSLPVFAAWADK